MAEPLRSADSCGGRIPRNLSAAVTRIDGIFITTDLARLILHGFRGYADLAAQRYGCAPDWIADVQYALGEAITDSRHGNQRPAAIPVKREPLGSAVTEILDSRNEVSTTEAAAALGMSTDLVRHHCAAGNLDSRKAGGRVMVTVASIESLNIHTEFAGARPSPR